MHCYFDLIIMNTEFEGNTIIAATRQHQKKLYITESKVFHCLMIASRKRDTDQSEEKVTVKLKQ